MEFKKYTGFAMILILASTQILTIFILMLLKKNPIKRFYRNSLKFLRKKKNRLSKFKVQYI